MLWIGYLPNWAIFALLYSNWRVLDQYFEELFCDELFKIVLFLKSKVAPNLHLVIIAHFVVNYSCWFVILHAFTKASFLTNSSSQHKGVAVPADHLDNFIWCQTIEISSIWIVLKAVYPFNLFKSLQMHILRVWIDQKPPVWFSLPHQLDIRS